MSNPGEWQPPISIQEQGSFAIGGVVIQQPGTYDAAKYPSTDGQTLYGDHAHITYQVPVHARKYPLAFLHGHLQCFKTWSTTPDGRDGYKNIFLRRGFPIYLIEQPRRGNAGKSTLPASLTPTPEDQPWFNFFRVGIWPAYFEGVQFARDQETLNQYFRQSTPNTGPFDIQLVSDACAALFEKIGPGVLVTHSQGGGGGWFTAMKSTKVRGIVAYEPGSNFVFPQGEVPAPIPSAFGPLEAVGVPMAEFL